MKKRIRNFAAAFFILFNTMNVWSSNNGQNSSFHFGFLGGYNQNMQLSGDMYGGLNVILNKKQSEVNFGYTYFDNQTMFDNVYNMLYRSHGMFCEFNYFFVPKVYVGVKSSLNMNFVDTDSQIRYELSSPRNAPTYFTGLAFFLQSGFKQNISKNICLRLQGQLGVHNYHIATGAIYFSNSTYLYESEKYIEEIQSRFLYNISAGLTYSF